MEQGSSFAGPNMSKLDMFQLKGLSKTQIHRRDGTYWIIPHTEAPEGTEIVAARNPNSGKKHIKVDTFSRHSLGNGLSRTCGIEKFMRN